MRNISNALQNHINSEVTTIATCIKISAKSGKIITLTDCDQDIYFDNLLYKSSTGFNPSSIVFTNDLSVDNLDINIVITDDDIKEQDIIAGFYDYSEVEVFLLNYNNLVEGIIKLTKAHIGEVNISEGRFTAEIRGITHKLNKLVGQLYSPVCRARFTDAKCGINKNLYVKSGNITDIDSACSFSDINRNEENGYFNFGVVEFLTNDMKIEIKNYSKYRIELFMPMPKQVKIGDKYNIMPGCDKSFISCKNKYNNAINFRGEPHIPGNRYIFSNLN